MSPFFFKFTFYLVNFFAKRSSSLSTIHSPAHVHLYLSVIIGPVSLLNVQVTCQRRPGVISQREATEIRDKM